MPQHRYAVHLTSNEAPNTGIVEKVLAFSAGEAMQKAEEKNRGYTADVAEVEHLWELAVKVGAMLLGKATRGRVAIRGPATIWAAHNLQEVLSYGHQKAEEIADDIYNRLTGR